MTGSDDPQGWYDPAAAWQDPAAGPPEPPAVFWPSSPAGEPAGGAPDDAAWPGRPDAGTFDTVQFDQAAMPPVSQGPKRRRVVIAASAAAAVVAAAVVAVVLVVPGGGKQPQPQPQSRPLTPAQALVATARQAAAIKSESVTFDEQVGGVTVSAALTLIRNPLRMSMTMTMSQGAHSIPVSALFIGNTLYMKISGVPGEPAALTSKWLELPLVDVGGTSLGSLLQNLNGENPAYQAQMLRAASHLRADGTQLVDGVSTTKYTGSIDPSTVAKYLPANVQQALAPGLKEITGNITFTAWIDQSHQLKKLVEHATTLGQPLTISYTVLSFNQPVTITAPPASQVVQVPASALQNSGL